MLFQKNNLFKFTQWITWRGTAHFCSFLYTKYISYPPYLNGLKIFPLEFFHNYMRYNKTMVGYKLLISYQFVFNAFFYRYFIYCKNKNKFCKTEKNRRFKKMFFGLIKCGQKFYTITYYVESKDTFYI